jgi:hypothetical protein
MQGASMTTRWPLIVIAMLCCLLASLLGIAPALAISGNQWLQLTQATRGFYVSGVLDGWSLVRQGVGTLKKADPNYVTGTVEDNLIRLTKCFDQSPYTIAQILAIVEKYMKDHPEEWHFSMEGNVLAALGGVCRE